MRSSLLISLSLLLLAGQPARAQLIPADDFFNHGAQLYISNNIPQAKAVVEQGLQVYPGDEKLKQLEALLKQQQQSQNSQSQQNQNQSQPSQPKSGGQKDQPSPKQQPGQDSQSPPKADEQPPNQAGQKPENPAKPPGQAQAAADKKDGEQSGDQTAEAQPAQPGHMTPEDAKRLLDAQKDGEQVLQLKPAGKPRDPLHPVKDW
jgi:hypothetical protein